MAEKSSFSFDGFSATAVMVLFFWFWHQSGWYRLDCSLGVKAACALIDAEYVKKPKP